AVKEVAAAITASTVTTVAVFLPLALVGDITGELFRPFALTVTIALAASLFVSLTIVPVLAYWFLGKKVDAKLVELGPTPPVPNDAPASGGRAVGSETEPESGSSPSSLESGSSPSRPAELAEAPA